MGDKTIGYAQFLDEYRPVMDERDECPKRYDHIPKDVPASRIWTVLDSGTITSGLAVVNRDYYIVTEVPVADGDMVEVEDEDEEEVEP